MAEIDYLKQLFQGLISLIKKEEYKGVFTLLSGTVLSQVIPIFATIIIARLYSSYDMGRIELFLRLSTFLVVFSTLRYEFALPLPKMEKHAFYLYEYTLKWNLYFLIIFQTILTSCYFFLNPFLGNHSFGMFYLLLPLFVFLLSYSAQSENWALRKERFSLLSRSRVANAVGVNFFKILFGLVSFESVGLILGNILGAFFGGLVYTKQNLIAFKENFSSVSRRKERLVSAKKYSDFPLINAPHAVSDIGREILIALLIGWYFGLEIVGLYAFAVKIIRIPISLVGVAFGQVFYQKASELISKKESILALCMRNGRDLILLSIIPTIALFFFGQEIFEFVFGEEWAYAGYLVEINSPALLVIFVSSPLSRIPMLLHQQRIYFSISLIYNLIFVLILWCGSKWVNLEFYKVWLYLTIFQFLYLFFIIFWYYKVVKSYEGKIE